MAVGVDPSDLAGCIAWGAADDLDGLVDGASVTSWPARVGPDLTSSSGGTAPTYVASGEGGMPGVRYGAGSVLRATSGLAGFLTGVAGMTVLVFARAEASASNANLLVVTTSGGLGRLGLRTSSLAITGSARRLDSDTAAGPSGTGALGFNKTDTVQAHAMALTVDLSAQRARTFLDGVWTNESTGILSAGVTSSTTPTALAVGCAAGDATSGWVGVVYEWAVYSRALSEGEVGRVTARWLDRYGLIPAPVATPPLPWDLDLAALKASARQTTGCWYVTPVSRDNAAQPDVWQSAYVDPNGQSAAFANIGGLWRNRPAIRPPRPEASWWLIDAALLVRKLQAAGLDGAAPNFISTTAESGRHWHFNRTNAMASLLTGFRAPFMMDGTATKNNLTVAQHADLILALDSYGSGWTLPDGRKVVYAYSPESCALPGQTAIGTVSSPASTTSTMRVFFDALDAELRSRGFIPAWLFVPIPTPSNYRAALDDLAWAWSWWGAGQAYNSRNAANDATSAHTAGKVYAQPVKMQDVRPRDRAADEGGGTEALRMQFGGAISAGAEMINVNTIGDFFEGTSFEGTEGTGDGWAHYMSYWTAWWKQGSPPPIVREGVLVSNRKHLIAAVPTDARNTSLMTFRAGTAPRDDVEVCTWLTAPATLTVAVGSNAPVVISAPAGFSTRNVPAAVGPVVASVTRSGIDVVSVTGVPLTATPTVQDLGRYPRMAVAEPPMLPTTVDAEVGLALDRVWAGSGRHVELYVQTPFGLRRARLTRTR